MKYCSTPLATRERNEFQIVVRYYTIPMRIIPIKNISDHKHWTPCGEESLYNSDMNGNNAFIISMFI